jgi:LruC domain-containing protein
MKTIGYFLSFTLLIAGLNNSQATTRYVSLTGSNTAPYTSLATAATDIQTAVNACVNGDEVLVNDGTYILATKVNIVKGITVKSINGSAAATIDGNNVTKCFEINHADAVLDGFTIRNGKNISSFGGGVNIKNGGTVRNCTIRNNVARDGGGVAIDDAGLLENCYITGNIADENLSHSNGYGGGVRLLNGGTVRNCEITHNISYKYGGGLNIWNAGTVYNCVIAQNQAPYGSGIRTRSNGQIYNTIIYFNTGSNNYDLNGAGYHYYNCCTTPALGSGYSTNCLTADPLFTSITPGSEDYHLQTGSPCIDAGFNAGWMAGAVDLDGNPRIENAMVDMGCYETSALPPDADHDGIPDAFDDYPADPLRAFNNFYPATGYGTLAFEDLWPGQGDYDFNDLVCDYSFKIVTNASNKVVEIFPTFIIKAFGASLHNGFGFQFANDQISQTHLDFSGHQLTAGYITLGANGLESGQTKPTFILFDDAFGLMQHPGSGTGVNTTPGSAYVAPDTLSLHIEFTGGSYSLAQLDISNFNPFLMVGLNRGHEVHLPDNPPTSLVNPGLFGQGQDNSIPSSGRYYKTANNLPWAINIYERFDYPQEKVDIINAYNHFVQWAESSGTLFPDWYQDQPGYRNEQNIY